jgi:DNA processing protein
VSPEDRALIAVRLAPDIGPRTLATLLDRFGSATRVLEASVEELSRVPHVGPRIAQGLRKAWSNGDVDAELALMAKHGVGLLRRSGEGYPTALAPLPGAPPLLYVRGQWTPQDATAIAIVGSRQCTPYGRRMAHRFAFDLAKAGITVVSGLARGIDAEAHRGALEAGGRTTAILANGLSRIYPPEHAELAERVVESGALLSESCMNMAPLPVLFPARNWIITGISRAVIVVEAGDKSGALISAKHAAEQGRDVFVVPGQVDATTFAGSLQLLRDGCRLVRSAADVLEDIEGIAPPTAAKNEPATPPPPKPTPRLDGPAAKVWELLAEPVSVDDLCRRSEQPIAALTVILTTLEMDGLIRKLPGNIYERS